MRWPSFDAAIFDCDSTLSATEGIDVLADRLGRTNEIAELTDAAMDGHIDLAEVYDRRLELLQPTRQQIKSIRDDYKACVVPDAKELIAALKANDCPSWIVSGGLAEPVKEFGTWLGVEETNIAAVSSDYDPFIGDWWQESPTEDSHIRPCTPELTKTVGKADVINKHVPAGRRSVMIGDGMSDVAAASATELFVAYAGVVRRPKVCESSPVVLQSESLAPLLALILGPAKVAELAAASDFGDLAHRCIDLINGGALEFNDSAMQQNFSNATNHSWES